MGNGAPIDPPVLEDGRLVQPPIYLRFGTRRPALPAGYLILKSSFESSPGRCFGYYLRFA